MNKQIKEIASIYIILILTIWLCYNNYETSKHLQSLKDEVIQVKKVAVEINTEKSEYIKVLQESRTYLNNEIDLLNSELKQYKNIKLLKDLRVSR